MNATIIVNPVSGKGDPQARRSLIKKTAKAAGWTGRYIETTKTRSAKDIAHKEVARGVVHIVACVGDGAVMEVLGVVANRNIKLGVVPLGTGNMLVRNLRLPLTIEEAVKTALTGKIRKVDVGQANGIHFGVSAGIGLDAEVMRAAERKLKNKWGFFAYVVATIKYLNNKSSRFEITFDDKAPVTVRAKTVMVSNLGKIFNDIEIVPHTHAQNGKLQIGIVAAKSLLSWLNIVLHALIGKVHKSPHYTTHSAKKITIRVLGKKRVFQCDGNSFTPVDQLSVKVCPGAVKIMS